MTDSYQGEVVRAATPIASAGDRKVLLTAAGVPFSGAAGTTVLPASGVWTASEMIQCSQLRRVSLVARYNAHASTTTGYAEIIVMACRQRTQPADFTATDDAWEQLLVTDGVVTAGALAAGTLVGVATLSQSWGKVVYRPLVIQLGAALANSDKIRGGIPIDVTDFSWVAFQAREAGDTTNRGVLNLSIVGGC